MEPDLQNQFEDVPAYEMYRRLETMFQKSNRLERYEGACALFDYKLSNEQPAGPHVLKMISLIERLRSLGTQIPADFAVDLIINSLPEKFDKSVIDFQMMDSDNSLSELHDIVVLHETMIGMDKSSSTSTPPNLKVQKKRKGKGKAKVGTFTPAKATASKVLRKGPKGNVRCYYCYRPGHWKRNCKRYQSNKNKTLMSKVFFVIEAFYHF